MSSGRGISIPLLSLPSQLMTSKVEKCDWTASRQVTNKLKELLEKKTERISIQPNANLPIEVIFNSLATLITHIIGTN